MSLNLINDRILNINLWILWKIIPKSRKFKFNNSCQVMNYIELKIDSIFRWFVRPIGPVFAISGVKNTNLLIETLLRLKRYDRLRREVSFRVISLSNVVLNKLKNYNECCERWERCECSECAMSAMYAHLSRAKPSESSDHSVKCLKNRFSVDKRLTN